jgi:hypothetical protein
MTVQATGPVSNEASERHLAHHIESSMTGYPQEAAHGHPCRSLAVFGHGPPSCALSESGGIAPREAMGWLMVRIKIDERSSAISS